MPSSVRQTACGLFYWPPLLSFCFAPKFLYFFYLASATHLTLTPGLHLRITQTHEHRFTGVHSLHIAGLRPLHAAPVFRRSRVAQLKQNLSIFSAIRARERETSLVIAAFLTLLLWHSRLRKGLHSGEMQSPMYDIFEPSLMNVKMKAQETSTLSQPKKLASRIQTSPQSQSNSSYQSQPMSQSNPFHKRETIKSSALPDYGLHSDRSRGEFAVSAAISPADSASTATTSKSLRRKSRFNQCRYSILRWDQKNIPFR